DVAVNDLRADTAAAVAAEIRALGRRAIDVPADVTMVPQIEAMLTRTVGELGRLDVLVNNAGFIRPNPLGAVSEDDWDSTFAVNARGLFFCLQSASRIMIEQGSGTIINIASVAGRSSTNLSLSPPYAASKAAVISITQQAARALAKHNVTVNAVCPGLIETAFNWKIEEEVGVKQLGLRYGEYLRQRTAGVPLGRIGQPEDVANVVAFLASPNASYLTGQSLNVDGGIVVT
ncbi:MAG TPA: SDR family oxidoreductase, partial [Chloroflexota bacterium]|nr:SDR family oxidoreductase [Chloroflexota bacterium]